MSFLLYVAVLTLPFPALAIMSYQQKVLPTLRNTYLFWAAFSLLNFSFLAPLAFPPLFLAQPVPFGRFVEFLLPPICVSLVVVGAILSLVRWKLSNFLQPRLVRVAAVFMLNAIFLLAFLVTADLYKTHLISKALVGHQPECMVVNSFLTSLRNAGKEFQFDAHAFFKERGKTFYWSYSQQSFFEGNERLDNNFACQPVK
jgi:hypothetical protein